PTWPFARCWILCVIRITVDKTISSHDRSKAKHTCRRAQEKGGFQISQCSACCAQGCCGRAACARQHRRRRQSKKHGEADCISKKVDRGGGQVSGLQGDTRKDEARYGQRPA